MCSVSKKKIRRRKNNDWHTLTASKKIHILEGESLDKKEMIE